MGFVGCSINPSGVAWTGPPLPDPNWYPLYEEARRARRSGDDLRHWFPSLRLIIPRGDGAIPHDWRRFRGIAQVLALPPLSEAVLRNVWFGTCVYHQPGIDSVLRVVPVDNILFASAMVGVVRGVDPETGHHFDDNRRELDAAALTDEDRVRIYERNARRVFPRLAF